MCVEWREAEWNGVEWSGVEFNGRGGECDKEEEGGLWMSTNRVTDRQQHQRNKRRGIKRRERKERTTNLWREDKEEGESILLFSFLAFCALLQFAHSSSCLLLFSLHFLLPREQGM